MSCRVIAQRLLCWSSTIQRPLPAFFFHFLHQRWTNIIARMVSLPMQGSLPPSNGCFPVLEDLRLQGPHIIGSIPSSFGNLRQLRNSDLSSSSLPPSLPPSLTGRLPDSLGRCLIWIGEDASEPPRSPLTGGAHSLLDRKLQRLACNIWIYPEAFL